MVSMSFEALYDFYPLLIRPVTFFIIILLTWVVAKFLKKMTGETLRFAFPRFSIRIQQAVYIFVWSFGVLFAINQLGLSIDAAILVIALIGITLVVALRDVLSNVFSRPFLETFFPFSVGDEIRIGKHSGKIIEINPFNTVVLTKKDELVFIPNSVFLKRVSVYKSPYGGLEIKIPIIVDSRLSTRKVEKNILKICKEFKEDINWKKAPILLTSRNFGKTKEFLLIVSIQNKERKGYVTVKLNEKIKDVIQALEKKI